MKKMNYDSYTCEICVPENFNFYSEIDCNYEKGTIAYAVEKFWTESKKIQKECTRECWKIRIASGKERRKKRVSYTIPAVLMELPGDWVRVHLEIDSVGVIVRSVEILNGYPKCGHKVA